MYHDEEFVQAFRLRGFSGQIAVDSAEVAETAFLPFDRVCFLLMPSLFSCRDNSQSRNTHQRGTFIAIQLLVQEVAIGACALRSVRSLS